MRYGYQFANLVGTVFKGGNVLFTPDGNTLISPVGNRVTLFDLSSHTSSTLPAENSKDISLISLSTDGSLLLTVDSEGRGLLSSVIRRTVLAHINFGQKVLSLSWSPDSKTIAVGLFKTLELWNPPALNATLGFAPFTLVSRLVGHHDDLTSIQWSPDGKFVLTCSKDGTSKLYPAKEGVTSVPVTFSAHSDRPVSAFFASDTDDSNTLYTLSRDGKLMKWQWLIRKPDEGEDEGIMQEEGDKALKEYSRESGRWALVEKKQLSSAGQKVKCCSFHRKSGLLAIGFSKGVFGLFQGPDFSKIQTLSISRHSVTSVAINTSGEWIAFASAKLGQLLVWEWRSETYIMKTQGHSLDMTCVAYSPNGRLVATGGDDGKVKIWDTSSWFCFVTFSDHTAPVTAVCFVPNGLSVISCSLDGTVRAYDLIRYRNYRVLSVSNQQLPQFSCLSLDSSGEIVAAGATDVFDVFVWSLQTGKLLDILSGHEGPVSSLSFSPISQVLATASWDRNVRLWDAFEGRAHREALSHGGDCLAIAWKPDGRELCTSCLDGTLSFWDVETGELLGVIEGAQDIDAGRRVDERRAAKTNPRGRCFTTITYSPDGTCILAASNESKNVCLYEISRKLLLRRFATTKNLSLDGVLDTLNSSKMTEAGPLDLIPGGSANDSDSDSNSVEAERRMLPGVKRGEQGQRHVRPSVSTKAVIFAPDGRSWAAATTEGLLVYSLDRNNGNGAIMTFDPTELDEDTTPESVKNAISNKEFLKALIISFRLNENDLIHHAFESVPVNEIQSVSRGIPEMHLRRFFECIAESLEKTPNIEKCLLWASNSLTAHAELIKSPRQQALLLPAVRSVHKQLVKHRESLAHRCTDNLYTLEFLCSSI